MREYSHKICNFAPMKLSKYSIKAIAQTDVGCVRANNEDSFAIGITIEDFYTSYYKASYSSDHRGSVFVVADGVGGAKAGDIASQTAIEAIRKQFEDLQFLPETDEEVGTLLKNMVHNAHEEIVGIVQLNKEMKGMGTTIVLAWLIGRKLHLAWCGDSRCYLIRFDKRSELLTEDHSKVWEMVKAGLISPEQARLHPKSNMITQSLGDRENPPKIDLKMIEIGNYNRILLCSDGLNSMLPDAVIFSVLENRSMQPTEAANLLISKAKQEGGKDNITLILAEVLPL